ncbi:Leucine Rich repeat-containing domain protein, partial [Trichostrongylus colubriformis]
DIGIAKICDALRNPEVVKKTSLTALVLWNNKITANAMDAVAGALCENSRLETLNIGSNPLGEMGVQRLRPALGGNGSNLHRIGLQCTQLNCQGAILLAECLADNSTLIRVDLRDNPGIGSAGLLALHSAMKINHSISLLNLDQSCIVASSAKEDFRRYYEDIKRYCERNKGAVQQKIESTAASVNASNPYGNDGTFTEPTRTQDKVKLDDVAAKEMDCTPSQCQLHSPSSNGGTLLAPKGKFIRSSSLTCAETVTDIHERLRVLGGSTHSLDETNVDSTKTIKKCSSSSHNSVGLTEWGSLPAIPQANMAAKPVVRKLRRFSVSPSSSTFDISKPQQTFSTPIHESPPRPKTLTLPIPGTSAASGSPLSAPVMMCSSPCGTGSWPSCSAETHDGGSAVVESCGAKKQLGTADSDQQCSKDLSNSSAAKSDSSFGCNSNSTANNTSGNSDESSQHLLAAGHRPSEDLMRIVRTVIGDLINYVVSSHIPCSTLS